MLDRAIARLGASPRTRQKRRELRGLRDALLELLGEDADRQLPRELLVRTEALWDPRDDACTAADPDGAAGEEADLDALSAITPLTVPAPSLAACVLVGTPMFGRPLSASWRERAAEAVQGVYRRLPPGERLTLGDLACRTAAVLPLPPLSLTSDWGSPVPGVSDNGLAELTATAGWRGSACLWRTYANAPWKVPLRAILDDAHVSVRVRAPAAGSWDLLPALGQACNLLARRLATLCAACEQRNAGARRTAGWHVECWHRRARSKIRHQVGPGGSRPG